MMEELSLVSSWNLSGVSPNGYQQKAGVKPLGRLVGCGMNDHIRILWNSIAAFIEESYA